MINETTLPYHYQLRCLRRFLEREISDFPTWKCELTSRVVRRITGLELIGGHYLPVKEIPNEHVWNFDHDRRLHVCLTMNQFDRITGLSTPDIIILPENNDALLVSQEMTWLLKSDQYGEERTAEEYANKYLSPAQPSVVRAAFLR